MNVRRSGLILLNKPEGVTSFRVMGPVKHAVGHKKIGHTGTLDKFASGVLPLLAGSYTKLTPFFTNLEKEYTGTIRFGSTTTTLDPEGEVTASAEIPSQEVIEAVLPRFRGSFEQVPPAYSAVHVDGKRAYRRARDGEEVIIQPRPVTVYSLEVREWNPPELTVTVRCSKGTYIRSLARDLAEACGSVGYLSDLRRTAVGAFELSNSVDPEQFDPDRDLLDSAGTVAQLPGIGLVSVREEAVPLLARGVPPKPDWFTEAPREEGDYAVEDTDGTLLALLNYSGGRWQYHFVIGRRAA